MRKELDLEIELEPKKAFEFPKIEILKLDAENLLTIDESEWDEWGDDDDAMGWG